MYKKHFSLTRRPFSAAPDVTGYYPAASIEAARTTVLHILENVSGIPLVFGESGMGKSLLLRVLEKYFEFDCHVVYMANRRLRSPKSLYQHLLFSLHQSYCGMDENELRLLFLDHLRQTETHNIVLLVDEAQSLGRSTLEELRMLLHQNEENQLCIRLVLAGDRHFEEHLTHPHLSAFQQQVVARCYLDNFRREETDAEILWQLKQAGCATPGSLFLPEARKAVHQRTEGVPRIVHQLCQQALACAAMSNMTYVDDAVVEIAWGILQQLPGSDCGFLNAPDNKCEPSFHATPVSKRNVNQDIAQTAATTAPVADETPLIEFGTLDDDAPFVAPTPAVLAADEPDVFSPIMPPETFPTNLEETEPEFATTFRFPAHVAEFTEMPEISDLGRILSDKVTSREKQSAPPKGESCQKLLDELSVMEHLLTQEISVINRMKKIESDCLTRRVRHVSPTQILASFPEMSKKQ